MDDHETTSQDHIQRLPDQAAGSPARRPWTTPRITRAELVDATQTHKTSSVIEGILAGSS